MVAYDLAVVGLGAMGAATLWSAAQRGLKAVGIDRFAPPHDRGSTHGETRIVRAAIGEDPDLSPLAIRSFALWDEIAEDTAETLVQRCGFLAIDAFHSETMHMGKDFFPATLAAAARYGIAHQILDARAVNASMPAFETFHEGRAYFEPRAGLAFPERVVAAQLRQAVAKGAHLRLNERVVSVVEEGAGAIRIKSDRTEIGAARAVIAMGPWLHDIVPPNVARHFKVTRQTLYWFDSAPAYAKYGLGAMPVFIWNPFYGFPAIGGPQGGLKIGTEDMTDFTKPDTVDRTVSTAEIARVTSEVLARFPWAGAVMRTATCLYTASPDLGFVIDTLPGGEKCLLIQACSGHGFKHAPAIGEIAADWAAGAQSRLDRAPFFLSRFG